MTAAQEAIKKAKNQIDELNDLKMKKFNIFQRLMDAKAKKDFDFQRQKNRKAMHVDINGIIDKQVRRDGMVEDVYMNRIVNSTPINMFDHRFRNQGTKSHKSKLTHEEMLILFNVKKVMLTDGKLIQSIK